MPINLDNPQRWKADIAASVDLYNAWFMAFAPKTGIGRTWEHRIDVLAEPGL